MADRKLPTHRPTEGTSTPRRESGAPQDKPARRPRSMHEDVETWCDCCSCEAEPRWQAVEDELERTSDKQ